VGAVVPGEAQFLGPAARAGGRWLERINGVVERAVERVVWWTAEGEGVVYRGFWRGVFEFFEMWCGKSWVGGWGLLGSSVLWWKWGGRSAVQCGTVYVG